MASSYGVLFEIAPEWIRPPATPPDPGYCGDSTRPGVLRGVHESGGGPTTTRLAYVEMLADLTASCAIGFLRRASWFAERGVYVQAVMTDDGSCYVAHAYGPRSASLDYASFGSSPEDRAPMGRLNRL
jgi:hypothetical protein